MSNTDIFLDFLYEMGAYQYPKAAGILFIAWLFFLCTRVDPIIDFCWSLNYWVIGLSLVLQYYDRQNYRGWIELVVLTLWFMRLGGFLLFSRVLKGQGDNRYKELVKRFEGKPNQRLKENLFFLVQYQFQAILVIPCSSTLYFVFRNYENSEKTALKATFIIGAVISIFGIIMEWIADRQIENYRRKKAEERKAQKEKIVELLIVL